MAPCPDFANTLGSSRPMGVGSSPSSGAGGAWTTHGAASSPRNSDGRFHETIRDEVLRKLGAGRVLVRRVAAKFSAASASSDHKVRPVVSVGAADGGGAASLPLGDIGTQRWV